MEKIDNVTAPSTTDASTAHGGSSMPNWPVAQPGQRTDVAPRMQAVEPIRRFFEYSHLPPRLQAISAPFGDLADRILDLPASAERSVALRKLLESKDATVRAALPE